MISPLQAEQHCRYRMAKTHRVTIGFGCAMPIMKKLRDDPGRLSMSINFGHGIHWLDWYGEQNLHLWFRETVPEHVESTAWGLWGSDTDDTSGPGHCVVALQMSFKSMPTCTHRADPCLRQELVDQSLGAHMCSRIQTGRIFQTRNNHTSSSATCGSWSLFDQHSAKLQILLSSGCVFFSCNFTMNSLRNGQSDQKCVTRTSAIEAATFERKPWRCWDLSESAVAHARRLTFDLATHSVELTGAPAMRRWEQSRSDTPSSLCVVKLCPGQHYFPVHARHMHESTFILISPVSNESHWIGHAGKLSLALLLPSS